MKKEDLRQIEFKDPKIATHSYSPNIDDKPVVKKGEWEGTNIKKGYFHLWKKSIGETTGNEYITALIERDDNGQMEEVPDIDIRFLN